MSDFSPSTYAILKSGETKINTKISEITEDIEEIKDTLEDIGAIDTQYNETNKELIVNNSEINVTQISSDIAGVKAVNTTQSAAITQLDGELDEVKEDKVDKSAIGNTGITSETYKIMFGGEFVVTTVNEEGYLSPHALATVTGRISKHYTYRITINGTQYILPCDLDCIRGENELKCYEYLGKLGLYISDVSYITHDIRNVPFLIVSDLDNNSSIDVFTNTVGTYTILVEKIVRSGEKLPNYNLYGNDYSPFEFKRNEGTYNGTSIGVNSLKNSRGTIAIGYGNECSGEFAQAYGSSCVASGNLSHAEGSGTTASGNWSHAEGNLTTASGKISHAEGSRTTASGDWSHAEGNETTASGKISHAEGGITTASGDWSHAEGYQTKASGELSHTEGYQTTASGKRAHSEGGSTTASGNNSHAEGYQTKATNYESHSEGWLTEANGEDSHSGGYSSLANGNQSFAHGFFTKATQLSQFAVGYGNNPQTDSIFEVGNGLNASGQPNNTGNAEPATRQNAFRVTQDGKAIAQTGLQIGNTLITEAQLQSLLALIS